MDADRKYSKIRNYAVLISEKTDMTFSLKKIRYFIATAEAGQVSHAGIHLGVSQSAITAAVQQLEDELGVSLFSRHPQGVSLTAEGARFLQLARNIMAAVNEAMRTPLAEDMKQSGKVRVGVTYTVAGYFLPPHHARFARTYPRIMLELIELPREAIEKGLVDGSLDIAVMLVSNLRNRRSLAHDTLIRSHRRLWLPVEHPFMKLETITLADIAREPYVMLTVDEAKKTAGNYWRPSGLRPKAIFTTSVGRGGAKHGGGRHGRDGAVRHGLQTMVARRATDRYAQRRRRYPDHGCGSRLGG